MELKINRGGEPGLEARQNEAHNYRRLLIMEELNRVGQVQILCQKISPMSCVEFSQMDAVSSYSEL